MGWIETRIRGGALVAIGALSVTRCIQRSSARRMVPHDEHQNRYAPVEPHATRSTLVAPASDHESPMPAHRNARAAAHKSGQLTYFGLASLYFSVS